MTKWARKQIQDYAISALESAGSNGIRYAELARKIHSQAPNTPMNSVVGALQDLSARQEVIRPSRGLWVLRKLQSTQNNEVGATEDTETDNVMVETRERRNIEEQFYEPFMQWLIGNEYVIDAMVVGGSAFKNKWATPDVIGIYKPRKSNPVPFPIEIVSTEIKTDGNQSITAFGQACAYRLFSHKTFIVMPSTIQENDFNRLEALCLLYGMGLVLFEINPREPNFQLRVQPQRFEPDMFYVNDFARRLLEVDEAKFNRLFG